MTRALIFDSGVGGLSVAAEIRALLPDLPLDYVSDDAFRPYGAKTPAQLRARLPGLVRVLADMSGADLVVIACNTASVTALEAIRAESVVPVVGVVPAVKPASIATRTGAIGVLGTPATIRQDYVDELIADFASDRAVRLLGSVELVGMAERLLSGEAPDPSRIRSEIAPLFQGRLGADIDTVVLACTHFPLLKDHLARAAPQSVQWIDSGEAIARRVASLLDTIAPDPRPDTAFLIGPEITRRAAFHRYGFDRVVALQE